MQCYWLFLFLYMSKSENLQEYIEQRLNDLNNQKDARDMIWKRKISFGFDSKEYEHLDAWQSLVKKKKNLVKWIWIDSFFLSLFIAGITSDFFEKFDQNWLKALVGLILMSLVIMLFFVFSAYFNLFIKFRNVKREVRKIIYQDILNRLKE